MLLPKRNVSSLNYLEERIAFLTVIALLGNSILQVSQPQRINYDILGNMNNLLHAYAFSGFQTEELESLAKPVWLYDSHY